MASFDTEDLHVGGASRPFDSDGYLGFDPRLPSQRFENFNEEEEEEEDHRNSPRRGHSRYPPPEGEEEDGGEEVRDLHEQSYGDRSGFDHHHNNNNNEEEEGEAPPPYRSPFDEDMSTGGGDSPSPFDSTFQPEFSPPAHGFSVESNGKGYAAGEVFADGEIGSSSGAFPYPPSSSYLGGSLNGSVLPPPEEMQAEEGFILREWKRKNAIHLEEKFRQEREKLSQIIDAADAFKDEFYEKRRRNCEANKINNRDKEKVFVENLTNFHATADKHYWKAVAELVPHELPSMESKSRGKDKKKPSVVINHGPKPGKATDLSRMRQVLVKLKHNPPAHMKPPPTTPPPLPTTEASEAKPVVAQASTVSIPPSQEVPVAASA